SPALVCCGDASLRDAIVREWPEPPPQCLFADVFDLSIARSAAAHLADSDPVTIIYTSGTSGEAKGVVLTAGNIAHMLGCTSARLNILMEIARARITSFITFHSASRDPGSCFLRA